MAYVRTVRTASGATAVQIVWSSRRGARDIEHLGSAHSEGEIAALKLVAERRLVAGQGQLELGLPGSVEDGPLPILGSKAAHLWDALSRAYSSLGLEAAAGGTRCSGRWCWHASSSPPANWTRCGCWPRPE